MGGANPDAEFSAGWRDSHPELASKMDSMTALMSQGGMKRGSQQPLSFGKMDAWQVGDAHPEAIGQGLAKGIETGLQLGSAVKGARGKGGKGGKDAAKNGGVDEYGYPYSIDENGQRIYDVGSRQVDGMDSFERTFGMGASPEG